MKIRHEFSGDYVAYAIPTKHKEMEYRKHKTTGQLYQVISEDELATDIIRYEKQGKDVKAELSHYRMSDNYILGYNEGHLVVLRPIKAIHKKYSKYLLEDFLAERDKLGYTKISPVLYNIVKEELTSNMDRPNAYEMAQKKYDWFIEKSIRTYQPADDWFEEFLYAKCVC